MAGLTLDTGGCRAAQGIAATRQGQCWVPHGQRKAWLGRLTLGTQGAAQGIARQGQCWVPHEQRKAWLGSCWVLEVQGKALPGKGNAGCPMSSARHGWAHAGYWRCRARHCCHQARAMLGAPWPAQGMAGQAHAGYSRCCTRHCQARAMLGAPWPAQGMAGLTLGAHGLGDHAGQDWVPQVQRKALPGQG